MLLHKFEKKGLLRENICKQCGMSDTYTRAFNLEYCPGKITIRPKEKVLVFCPGSSSTTKTKETTVKKIIFVEQHGEVEQVTRVKPYTRVVYGSSGVEFGIEEESGKRIALVGLTKDGIVRYNTTGVTRLKELGFATDGNSIARRIN